VLREFHRRLRATGRRWRDVNAAEACVIVHDIARNLAPEFEGGKFEASGAARFAAEVAVERLERLIGVLVEWMQQYDFDPVAAELSFGLEKDGLPAWRLALPGGRVLHLRGRMDRVDLCFQEDAALAVVLDYKSSARSLDATKLHHGLELQLLTYLCVLERVADTAKIFDVERIVPVGAFYVPLNGEPGSRNGPRTRDEAQAAGPELRRLAYQHSGRFRADKLPLLDNRDAAEGDQFRYRRNQDGRLSANSTEALPPEKFEALLRRIEEHIRDFASRIFDGEVQVSPYRIGSDKACSQCAFGAVCRFDSWTDEYRVLSRATRPTASAARASGASSGRAPRKPPSRKAP
jgi:ATP-dependent helicase/nuclease subunit B